MACDVMSHGSVWSYESSDSLFQKHVSLSFASKARICCNVLHEMCHVL